MSIILALYWLILMVVCCHQLKVDCHPKETADQILNKGIDLGRVMVELAAQSGVTVFGIGIGLPGVIDIHQGILVFAPNLGWRDTPIQKIFYDQFKITGIY